MVILLVVSGKPGILPRFEDKGKNLLFRKKASS
jgi:hypothetical protein